MRRGSIVGGKRGRGPRSNAAKGRKASRKPRGRASRTEEETEVARLRRELSAALEYQTATSEVLRIVASSPDHLQPVFDAMLDKATDLCGAKFGMLLIYDGETYNTVAVRNLPGAVAEIFGHRPLRPQPTTASGRVLETKQPIAITDLRQDIAYIERDPLRVSLVELGGARAQLVVPLLKKGDVIGCFLIYVTEPRPFSDSEIALVSTFADQAVIAIENARLITETREALERQTATAEVLRVINASPGELAPVFDTILEKAHSLCDVAYGSLHFYDGEVFRAVATHGISEAFAARLRQGFRPVPTHPAWSLLAGARFAQIADCAEVDDPIARAGFELSGIRTALFVPLRREQTYLGQIVAARREVKPFTDKEIALLENFAAQAVIAIENARLINETREALEQQTATAEVLRVINASPGKLAPVFEAILQKAHNLCDVAMGTLQLYDGEKSRAVAVHGLPEALADQLRAGYVIGPNSPHRPLLEGARFAQVPDLRETDNPVSRAAVELADIRTILFIPLRKDERLLGLISASRTEVKPFTEKEIALLESFAAQAVIAIENARLLGELRTRNNDLAEALRYQTATSEVLRIVASSPDDLQPVFDAMLEKAMALCEARYGFLALYDGESYAMAASRNVPEALRDALKAGPHRPARHTALWRLTETKAPVHIEDVRSDIAYLEGDAWRVAAVETGGARAQLVVPLLKKGELMGAFIIYRQEPRRFADNQIALVTNFADQAVIAIENARLLGELRSRNSELAESLEQQTATAEVLHVISRSPGDLKSVFQAALENATRICDAKFGVLQLYEDGGFRIGAVHKPPPAFAEAMARREALMRPTPQHPFTRMVTTKAVVHIADLMESPAYKERDYGIVMLVEGASARTFLAVPMLKENEVAGVIAIYRQEVRPFTDKQIAVVVNFANQAVIAIENARLLGELRSRNSELGESLERQTATSEVLRVISSSPADVQPVFETIAASAQRLCEGDYGVVIRFDGELAHLVALCGIESANTEPLKARFPSKPVGLLAEALEQRVVVHAPDILLDQRSRLRHEVAATGGRAFVFVPMLREGTAIGAILVMRNQPRAFTDKQIQLLQTFADQAVIAVENARLLAELRQRTGDLARSVDELTATSDVLKIISRSSVELETVLDTLVETAARLCHADQALMFRRQGDRYFRLASHGPSRDLDQYLENNPFAAGRGTVTGRAVAEGRTVHIVDSFADPEYTFTEEGKRLTGGRTHIAVPLLRGEALVGVFTLWRTRVAPFTEKEIELVTTFADQAVIAIENARLFDELRERSAELARSVEELTTLREVGEAVSSTLDLAKVLETIVARAVALGGADAGAIYRYRNSDRKFRFGTSHGFDAELAARIRKIPIPEAETMALARTIQQRVPAQIPDLQAAPHLPLRDLMVAAGFRSVLMVPLVGAGRVFGVLSIQKKTVGEFPESTVKLMQTFATQSVLAIQNARLFREVEEQGRALALASQHKSQFLANMSHELRTPLNAVLGYAELLADGIYGELGEKARGVLERIQSNGKHLLGLINDVLDLSKIEAGQLTLAIDDYAMPAVVHSVVSATESLAKNKGLSLVTSVPRALPMGRGDERRLTQVLLNLVGNAIKFTDKGSVGIEVTLAGNRFEVAVKDTGPGIAKEDQARIFEEFQQVDNSNTRKKGGTGLGLAISRRIVEMHGGALTVESEPGKGSTFVVAIPVQVEPAKEVA